MYLLCVYSYLMVGAKTTILNSEEKGGFDIEKSAFSWNLNQERLGLENGTDLHKGINFSYKNLGKFKNVVEEQLFEALDKKFGESKGIHALRKSTEIQMDKNENSELKKGKINKVVMKFAKKRKEIASKKEGKELIKELYEIDKQEKKELSKIDKSLSDLEKSQVELKRQKEFLTVLTSTEIWETLLSMPEEDAPRINLNIGGTSYKIKKGEKYENEDGKLKIKESIEKKLIYSGKFDDNYVNFVLNFFLRPFNVEGKDDEETLKYYIYSIIDCIETTKVVQKIGKLYEKRVEVEEKLDGLNIKIKTFSENVKKLEEGIEKEKAREFEKEDIKKMKLLLKSYMSDLKDDTLVGYLKYLRDNDNNFGENLDISEKNIEKYRSVIEYWLNLVAEKNVKLTKYIGKSGEVKELNSRDIKLNGKEDFLLSFEKIAEFIGKQWGEKSKKQTERLWYAMKNDLTGFKNIKGGHYIDEKSIDLLAQGDILMEMNRALKGGELTEDRREKFKNILRESRDDMDQAKRIRDYLKEKRIKGERDEEMRKIFINEYLEKIFGIKLYSSDLEGVEYRRTDETLVITMVLKLVEKVNQEKRRKENQRLGILNSVYSKMLMKNGLETGMSEKLEKNVEDLIRGIIIKNTVVSSQEEFENYDSLIKEFNKIAIDLGSGLENCGSLVDYDNIIKKMNEKIFDKEDSEEEDKSKKNPKEKDTLEEKISKESSNVENLNNIMEWCSNWKNVPLAEIPEEVDIEICRMIAIKRILDEKELMLADKFHYIKSLRYNAQNRVFCVVCDNEDDGNILKNIFGDEGVEVVHDENIDAKIQKMEEELKNKFGCKIVDEKKFEKQARSFLRVIGTCDTTLKKLDKKEGKKNCRSLRVGNTQWRILLLEDGGTLYFDSLLLHDDYDERINKSKVFR